MEPPALIIEKDSTVARKHDITLRRKLIREPYIYTNDVYTDLIKPAGDGEYAINLPKLYTPALFRNEDYSFSFSDTEKGIESAIIVIRHDPANENSHIKQITVEITDNNGVTKSYEFSVELYQ